MNTFNIIVDTNIFYNLDFLDHVKISKASNYFCDHYLILQSFFEKSIDFYCIFIIDNDTIQLFGKSNAIIRPFKNICRKLFRFGCIKIYFCRSTVYRSHSESNGMMRDSDMLTQQKVKRRKYFEMISSY